MCSPKGRKVVSRLFASVEANKELDRPVALAAAQAHGETGADDVVRQMSHQIGYGVGDDMDFLLSKYGDVRAEGR